VQAHGLGQGMSLGLAEAGADLVLVDYVPSTETEATIKKWTENIDA